MQLRELLEKYKAGEIGADEAEEGIRALNVADMGYAVLDTDRKGRTGFAEVVYCEGKETEFLTGIFKRLLEEQGEVMGTRASASQFEVLKDNIDGLHYDPVSRIVRKDAPGKTLTGNVAVVSAGTADISVAEEAAQTAEFFGSKVFRYYDLGVSGIHRILSRQKEIADANCVIVVAGMEGALASVLGGLVRNPIIAVPTSVGYGANLGGVSAMLTMINSCANGIAVVNIDGGYRAGYIATQINRLACSSFAPNNGVEKSVT
ncbi:MAG: nickel pincer cofactor biosynthesis protein LarB [Lachnospiraceae bacterium]|nr:nickel pincer cofactor biosynthesis protein LarB [Lachnospiraceae bacterium]